jgi:cysteine/glycine-rich protein
MEKITYDGIDYHKTCFKCLKCSKTMTISAVAKIKGDLYCKNCFKAIFKEKGNYASFGAKTLAQNAPYKDLAAAGMEGAAKEETPVEAADC